MIHSGALAIVAAYIVLLFVVTWRSQRLSSAKGVLGYLLAGRQMPAWVCAAALAGLAVGGASTIGVAERAYTVGLSAGWYNAAWAFGALVMALVAVRRYRRLEITTLTELFDRHYGPAARVLAVLGQLLIQLVVTSLQYVAGGAILSSLMPEWFTLQTGMVATAFVFVGITLVGGFWAAGLTNVANVVVIYVGLCLSVALTLARVGGVAGLASSLPAEHPGFDLVGIGLPVVVIWFVVMTTTATATQSVVQVGFAARDERAAQRGFLLGALLIVPVGFLSALLGMAARVLHPGIAAAEALPKAVLELPTAAAGTILAGLWAADVSTASALLIGSATLVTHDVVRPLWRGGSSERRERWVCRVCVLLLAGLTFAMAITVRTILEFLIVGLTLTAGYAIVVVATMFAPSICRRSTGASVLGATIGALALWYLSPRPPKELVPASLGPLAGHPVYFVIAAGLVALALSRLLDRRTIAQSPEKRALAA